MPHSTKEKYKEYCDKNIEKIRERHKKYRQEHAEEKREQTREYHREYYAKNKEKLRQYHNQYYKDNRNKQVLVDYLGGKCIICGYNKCIAALDFHHLDPAEKEFILSRSWQKKKMTESTKMELDKCVILCANCHREAHYDSCTLNKLRVGGATAWETITSV